MKVLFVCIHNSARSQMAEAFLKGLGGPAYEVESAGLSPGSLNPLVVQAMAEEGYDLSGNAVKDVFTLFKQGRSYDLVIKVCDQSAGQRCPVFPAQKLSLQWDFADPSTFVGTEEEKLAQVRLVRDAIQHRIRQMVAVFNLPQG